MAQTTPLTRRKGDTFPINITVTDENGVALDITGNTFSLDVTGENDPNAIVFIMQLTGSIVIATDGTVTFPISAAESILVGDYYYVVKQTAGTEITTILEGSFAIEHDGSLAVAGTNSYGSLSDADAYFNVSINADNWDAFDLLKKQQGIIEATRILERQTYEGEKEVGGQDLQFPRTGLTDGNSNSLTGAETLTIITEASFEYALFLLSNQSKLNTKDASGIANIKSVGAGSAKVSFFKAQKTSRFPLSVTDLIRSFISGATGKAGAGVSSGTCDKTQFEAGLFNIRGGFK